MLPESLAYGVQEATGNVQMGKARVLEEDGGSEGGDGEGCER